MILCLIFFQGFGQRFLADSSYVRFYSDAPVEDIEAVNTNALSLIDLADGEMAFSIPIDGFIFEKSLMQEHFNENYLESHRYPKATFTAAAVDWNLVSPTGKSDVSVIGDLEIHGVKKQREIRGTMEISEDRVIIDAKFYVQLVHHKIKIPKALFYNIAETIEVTVHFEYKPYSP